LCCVHEWLWLRGSWWQWVSLNCTVTVVRVLVVVTILDVAAVEAVALVVAADITPSFQNQFAAATLSFPHETHPPPHIRFASILTLLSLLTNNSLTLILHLL
jgi:hypothetical protein